MFNKHGEKLDFQLHEADRDDVLIIIGHGLTGHKDRALYINLAKALNKLGWPCLRFSFSGHGDSEGSFSEMTISKEVSDLQALLDQVKGNKKIAYIGHSMGAAVGALTIAREERVSTLISLAGMVHTQAFYDQEFGDLTPDQDTMWEEPNFPLSSVFKKDLYQIHSTIPAIRDLRIPTLFIHGEADDVVLPQHSVDIHDATKGHKHLTLIPECDHHFDNHHTLITTEIHLWCQKYLK